MPKREVTTKFYMYHQNNSGGVHYEDEHEGIGPTVFIEATSPEKADDVAERLGMFSLSYCECCGERFNSARYENNYEQAIMENVYDFMRCENVYVHHLDGTIEKISAIKT